MDLYKLISILIGLSCVVSCQSNKDEFFKPSPQHLIPYKKESVSSKVPSLVYYEAYIPEPEEIIFIKNKYSIEANDVSVREILVELCKDANLNLDLQGNLDKKITIHVIDQTIDKILERLEKNGILRYEIKGNHVTVSSELQYQKNYIVSYLNINRHSKGYVSLSLNLDKASKGNKEDQENRSIMKVESNSQNHFWEELEKTLKGLIETNDNLAVNRSTGVVNAKAKRKTHRKIANYIGHMVKQSHQQVLVEATILEVNLNRDSSTGIDWHRLARFDEWSIANNFTSQDLDSSDNFFSLAYQNNKGNFSSAIKLLEEFGEVRVLSSPKIMAINNQPSLLKVVDNRVYFTLDVDMSTASGGATQTSVETTVNTIPVGFSMSLTPFVSSQEDILLNIRPSISRIVRFVNDPSPLLAEQNIVSAIPEVQVREMETVLKLKNGQLAILGGLMQDTFKSDIRQLPNIGSIPVAGEIFKGKHKQSQMSELLVLLKPIIINADDSSDDINKIIKKAKKV